MEAPDETNDQSNDKRFEQIVANLLRTGVSAAAVVVALGGICYLIGHGHDQRSFRVFRADAYRSVGSVLTGIVRAEDCQAVIQLGLLLLIATPIVRVAVSLVTFAWERDRAYVAVTCIVLAVLLYSLNF